MFDLLCDAVFGLALIFAGTGVTGLLLGIVAAAGAAITDGLCGRGRRDTSARPCTVIETLK